MTRSEIVQSLAANIGKQVRVAFSDGELFAVSIVNIDDEGFVHKMVDADDAQFYWTRFEDVITVQPELN